MKMCNVKKRILDSVCVKYIKVLYYMMNGTKTINRLKVKSMWFEKLNKQRKGWDQGNRQ